MLGMWFARSMLLGAGVVGSVAAGVTPAKAWYGGYYGGYYGYYGGYAPRPYPYYVPYDPRPPIYYAPPPVYAAPRPIYAVPVYNAPRVIRPRHVGRRLTPTPLPVNAAPALPSLRPAPAEPLPPAPRSTTPLNNVYPPESGARTD